MKNLAMIAATLLFLSFPPALSHAGENYPDWMGRNMDLLRDRPLNEVTVLGSHDAATSDMTKDSPVCIGYMVTSHEKMKPYPGEKELDKFKTQKASIARQLEYGVRYLDLRPGFQSGAYWSHHGYLSTPYQGPGGIFTQIREFLERNPYEVLILNMQHFFADDHEMNTADLDRFYAVVTGELGELLIPRNRPAMKLGEIWNGKGRIVMIWSTDTGFSDPMGVVWDHRALLGHWFHEKNRAYLLEELDDLANRWRSGEGRDKFKELQAIKSSNKKLSDAPETNAKIAKKIDGEWSGSPITIIMVNDAVNSRLMPLLMRKNGLR